MKAKLVTSRSNWVWLTVAGLLCVPSASLRAQSTSENEYNRQYRSYLDVPLGDNYTGRSPYMKPKGQPEQPPPPPPRRVEVVKQAEPPPVRTSCAEMTTGLIRMGKTMPAEVSLGQEFMYELNPTATGCAGNVVVTDRIPAGATYVRSEPAAEVQGDRLVWHLNDMEPGETRNIKVWLRADKEGTIGSCATVAADPRVCAQTVVGKPVLALTKTGPETALLGSEVTYNITVSNTGSAVAKDVVVTDSVPEGLTHSSGQRELSAQVGDLAPNQSRSIPMTLRADKRGKVCNPAVATSSNAGRVNAEACTTIVQPGLKIVKTTNDKELLINRTATYAIVVSNTGDVPLTGVVVTDTAAAQTSIAAADGGTASGNVATWNVGELKPGEQKELSVKVLSRVPGRFCDTVTVACAQGLRETAEACTEWIGVTGVLVEVVDDPDPIQVGETTTFTIRVTNQGSTRDIEDLNVKAAFEDELDPVNASGGGTIEGKAVTWPTVARLAPKQSVTYTIVGKAVKAGDHRLQTQVTTKERTQPIVELESTTVY
jgi:uncharacterized repeat protein (TIGR01451 family)